MNFLLAPEKRRLRPTDYEKALSKLVHMDLTPDEEKCIEILRCLETGGSYGTFIRDAFIDYSTEKARSVFKELWQQIDDNKDLMYQILGYDAYNALLKIKPNHE